MTDTVVIADSDPFNLRLLQEACESANYEVLAAASGPEVLDAVARVRPDAVLLHVGLIKLDGLQVLKILKSDINLQRIPVILSVAVEQEAEQQECLQLGAEDYVIRPYRVFEVQRRIRVAIKNNRTIPPPPSIVPPPSTPQLQLGVEYEITRAQRYGHELTCVAVECDVDDALAGVVRECIRMVDQLFHTDEGFVVLLPETDLVGAAVVIDRIRERLSVSGPVRVGAACANANSDAESGVDLLAAARAALK